jgi:signal peptidase I
MSLNLGSIKAKATAVVKPAPGGAPHGSTHDSWAETARIVVHALLIAFVVRVFLYQPFNIPSGSMKSTLLVGDFLFVSKLSYGYSTYTFPQSLDIPFTSISIPLRPQKLFSGRIFASEPKRGDVAVFKLPRDNSTDFIKRVIGLPGDEIETKHGVLFINGQEIPKKRVADFVAVEEDGVTRASPRFEETLPNGVRYTVLDTIEEGPGDNMGPYKVPPGHYFMMGDNRDNSTDSRFRQVGFVPFENFVGRADLLFFSAAIDEPNNCRKFAPWTWPTCVRFRRLFSIVR